MKTYFEWLGAIAVTVLVVTFVALLVIGVIKSALKDDD